MRIAYLSAIAFLSCSLVFAAEPAAAPQPPQVKKIVLYKHGIGYFERHGKVNGNAMLTLPFQQEQMKDLLASFFVLDLNGGTVNAVLYDSKDPLSKQLEGILIDVPAGNALSQFLATLKGAKIGLSVAGEKVNGRVMGIEPITERSKDGQVLKQDFKLVLLTEPGAIRAFELAAVAEITLQDAQLQRDLTRLLTLTLESKYTERKNITVEARGDGERQLVIGYLVEQPIWKASYRMILEKDKGEALLQAWAMAENNTEEDWNEVEMSFVAGNPLSYVMDLYTPYYPVRPQVPIPGLSGMAVNWGAAPETSAPMAQELAEAEAQEAMPRDQARKSMERSRRADKDLTRDGVLGAKGQFAARPMADLAQQTMAAMATGTQLGELFSYEAKEKVSIPRGKAALVPIIVQKMKGERVVYYKAAFSPRPVNAYQLVNQTELTLEAGPVTFFEGGASLGEGILSHVLTPGAKEIIPYALEAALSVTPSLSGETKPAYRGVLANGMLTLTSVEIVTSSWRVANKGKEARVLLLDQPINAGFKLAEPVKADEEVENHYRFRLNLKGGESRELKVVQKRDVAQTLALANLGEEQIRFYARQEYFSDKAKAFFSELAELQAQRTALVRQSEGWQAEAQRLNAEQARLRDNLGVLRQNAREEELRAKWVKTLEESENALVNLRKQIEEAAGKRRGLDEQLAKKVLEYRGE